MQTSQDKLFQAIEHHQKGNLKEACLIYAEILSQDSSNLQAMHLFAVARFDLGYYDEGINLLYKLTELAPNYESFIALGKMCYQCGHKQEAVENFKYALELSPDNAELYMLIGDYLKEECLIEDAINCYQSSLEIDRAFIAGHFRLGEIFKDNSRFIEAEACFQDILKQEADNISALYMLGEVLGFLGKLEEAVKCFEKVIRLDPKLDHAYFELSMLYIALEKFDKGWDYFKYREAIRKKDFRVPEFSCPRWCGEDISGKQLYIYPEMGYGDIILAARYLPYLAKKGVKPVFKTADELVELFKSSPLNAEILPRSCDDGLVSFDCYTQALDLPAILWQGKDNIPYKDGYLKADKEKIKYYKEKYFSGNDIKLGICWKCKNSFKKDFFRSFNDASILAELSQLDCVSLYSPQKGESEGDLITLPTGINVINLGKTFSDFSDTAAAISSLNAVITVDTSIVHLSGALGAKTYLLSLFPSDFRWFQDTESSSWYSSVRIFRQSEAESQQEYIIRFCSFLKEELGV